MSFGRRGFGGPERDGLAGMSREPRPTDAQLRVTGRLWHISSLTERTVLVALGDGFFSGEYTAYTASLEWADLGRRVKEGIHNGLVRFRRKLAHAESERPDYAR